MLGTKIGQIYESGESPKKDYAALIVPLNVTNNRIRPP